MVLKSRQVPTVDSLQNPIRVPIAENIISYSSFHIQIYANITFPYLLI